jgi:hypothetical protein
MIRLGVEARDIITGFEGTVTGRCEYLTGCSQYNLIPKAKDGAYIESRWFDEQRLMIINATAIQLDNAETPGADFAPPSGY